MPVLPPEQAKELLTPSWGVLEHHYIAHDKVVAEGQFIRWYNPMEARELPSEVYRLSYGDKKAVLEFVSRYGLLGRTELINASIFLGPDADPVLDNTEPLEWIWAHAHNVRLVMDGLRVLSTRDEREAASYLHRLALPQPALFDVFPPDQVEEVIRAHSPEGVKIYGAIVGIREHVEPRQWRYPDVMQIPAVEVVGHIVGDILNENLALASRQVFFDPASHSIKSAFQYHALIQYVYQQLLETAEGGRIAECDECHALFIQTDGRQRFCPPRFKEKESRCALRYRQREWRQRRKQEGGSEDGQA